MDVFNEAALQALIHARPECLPISEIDPVFSGAVPICRELNTVAGPIDNLLVTPSGLPVLVECKLWRNPEARREVVGQILDYAKELSRWSSSDLQREVSRCLKRDGNPLLELLRTAAPDLSEIEFNDALTANLRRGRFLLLIVGDGIREGVEAIAEYLQTHAGLHFSLGLIELPIYMMPDGTRLAVPRVLARTTLIARQVIAVPEGHVVSVSEDAFGAGQEDDESGEQWRSFWAEFISTLKLDDPEQPRPNPTRSYEISLSVPAPTSWISVFSIRSRGELRIAVGYWQNTAGEFAVKTFADNWEAIKAELDGDATLTERKGGRPYILESRTVGSLADPELRKPAFAWLAKRVNTFVNVSSTEGAISSG